MKTSSQESETKKCSLTPNTFQSNATCANIHELPTPCTQQKNEFKITSIPKRTCSEKTLKTSSIYSHTQPCPFTFLTAVKCKFPVDKSYAARNTTCKLDQVNPMDSIEPLNVPNLKISPNFYHVSGKTEGSNDKLLASKKSDTSCKTKSNNTNQVLTQHSSSSSSKTLKSRNSQSLKSSSNVQSKGKILLKNNVRKRDISNDQENRLKKIRKEDGSSVKTTSHIPSTVKNFKNQKHISRRDILDQVANKIVKNDKILSRGFQDNSNAINKSGKTSREKLDQPSKFSTKSHQEISSKSSTASTGNSVHDHKKNTNFNVDQGQDNNQVLNILNSSVKSSLLEHQNTSNSADLMSISEAYSENLSNHKSSNPSQDSAMAKVEKYQKQGLTAPSLTLSSTKQGKLGNLHIQQNNIQYISTVLSPNDSNQSSNDSIIETKLSQESLSEKLMDPMRISFREDSYSNQPEFTNLVTPNVNLTIRSKRRKQVIRYVDSDPEYQDSKVSKSDHSAVQEVEVQAKTESNTSDQLVSTHKSTSFTDGSIQEKATSNNTREKMSDITTKSKSINNDSQEIKSWSENIETEINSRQYGDDTSLVFSKEFTDPKKVFHLSLNSADGSENVTRMEDISLSKKMRTMSEISLHETTSSIKTESGTEISISLRDVTCSFNKNLDLEMAQLIDDERQRYNKIEMLFKSREKSLNDRTRKLVKLEEQKKVLRDTGQDNRISSVKKKQRALLLKLQQEKEEMNRLKELHKIASQERKLMLQKQRDMFNPDMSTKNILNKLKRSADSQSPRRLSGPMKGYDIRSNSSISSLIDSDKSLLDRSKFDCPMNLSDVVLEQKNKTRLKLGVENKMSTTSHDTSFSKIETQVKCDLRSSKFDERMPKSDMKYQLYDIESVLDNGALELLKDDHASLSRSQDQNFIFENVRKKSNAFIEEFTEIWKSHFSQSKNEASAVDKSLAAGKTQDDIKVSKRKSLKLNKSKTSVNSPDTFCQKSKSLESIDKKGLAKNYDELDEVLSKPTSVQELIKHSDLLKERNEELLKDIVDERNNFAKQSSGILSLSREQERQQGEVEEEEEEIIEKSDNVSVQSHVSLAISHQSSNDSDKSYLKSVVIRSQQDYQPNSSLQTSKKLEQILKAREATLISRRNCVEEWISWHARLRDEEERVSRMEKAAYKLVSATARTLSLNDTTVSSDNSDVEGRIEVLTRKLADRRYEMTRLKKEARKQAKRRLRALEANLLTQIKRYDATIDEMRKKLETKKGPNKEKLEIESKSVNDYKVPDIPLKNIQEIYKRSGLLRSDVDLVPINKDNDAKGAEPSLSRAENSNAEKIRATTSNIGLDQDHKSAATESNDSQSQSEIHKSESSNDHTKDINLSRSSNISASSLSRVASLKKNSNSNSQEISTHDSQDELVLSKKLSHIQLHNKELNDDIHNLENDLKELSELMLNFSKKSSDQNSVSADSTRKTSAALDELVSQDVPKQLDKSKLDVESDTIVTDLQMRVQEALSNGIPETDNISTSIEELYSEIKNKDNNLGQLSHRSESPEKSIETEELHRMSKSLGAVDEKDYKNDTCSILEIISRSGEQDEEEINELAHQPDASSLSHASENHLKVQKVDDDSRSTDTVSQKQSGSIDQDHESSIQTESKSDDQQVGLESEKLLLVSDKSQDSIENGNQALPVESANVADSDQVMTELDLSSDKHDESVRKSVETQDAQDYDRHSISDVEDSTIFVPKGESTNLHETFVLKLDSSSDVGMGMCSEEFNDILEIIERETKNDDNILQEANVHGQVQHEEIVDQENTKSRAIEKPIAEAESIVDNDANLTPVNIEAISVQLKETSEKVDQNEDDSSDGEQTNNLIEVVENKLDVLQKSAVAQENKTLADKPKTHVTVFLDKTLQVIRDPEYEDISEESLEVSDIFNNTNPAFHRNSKKQTTVPEKYIIKSETDQVLRILDEISNKSNKVDNGQQEILHDDLKDSPIETNLSTECSSNEIVSPCPVDKPSKPDDPSQEISSELLVNSKNEITPNESSDREEEQELCPENTTSLNDDKKEHRDTNTDSGLDINAFNENAQDALLLDEKVQDITAEFRTTPMGVSSEKDIESMIKKLKASLEQPGIEVAELEAKLLEIENLQIELAIKKLEAEEVSYYVREIPNKPPPPYTPPGSVIQSGSNNVPSSLSIIPTNIEELLLVTEKATAIIHVNKKSGEDVQLLEAPEEIHENGQESGSDALKKNRLIYNTFLFDLCKELVVDIYKVEEENPGPSWTRPQVKTKRVIKIPKSVNELNEYVSKEVATLFGFKTKLQRENMVMRWSRKRRDRVDELLAKEAQAEEKEWTKFHHDELAVKNELTVTILNNLLMETTSCIKNVYAKKQKLSVL